MSAAASEAIFRPIQEGVWRHLQTTLVEQNLLSLDADGRDLCDTLTLLVCGYLSDAATALGPKDASQIGELFVKVALWQAAR